MASIKATTHSRQTGNSRNRARESCQDNLSGPIWRWSLSWTWRAWACSGTSLRTRPSCTAGKAIDGRRTGVSVGIDRRRIQKSSSVVAGAEERGAGLSSRRMGLGWWCGGQTSDTPVGQATDRNGKQRDSTIHPSSPPSAVRFRGLLTVF